MSAPNVVSARVATKATVLLRRPAIMTLPKTLSRGGQFTPELWIANGPRFLGRRGGQPAPPQSGSRAPRLKDDLSSPAWRKSGNSSQYKRLIYPKWEL